MLRYDHIEYLNLLFGIPILMFAILLYSKWKKNALTLFGESRLVNELMHSLREKEFTNVRKWIVQNLDNDPVRIFRRVYDNLYDYLDGSTIPHAVVIIADYQYKSAFVSDQEINLLACMTEIMGQVKFK